MWKILLVDTDLSVYRDFWGGFRGGGVSGRTYQNEMEPGDERGEPDSI
jgi:hypothetical protein